MAETPKLKLPKITGNMTWDVVRDVNALADGVDAKAGAAGGLATLGADGKVPAGQIAVDTSGLATKVELAEVAGKVTTHQADMASQELGKGASLVGVHDAGNLFTATTVEGALKEAITQANAAFTSASNGKTAIKNAVAGVDPTVVIPADPTFAQLAAGIGKISTGKKWASGTAKTGSLVKYINTMNQDQYANPLIVNGLNFKPSRIYVHVANGNLSTYYSELIPTQFTSTGGWSYPVKLQAPAFVNETGFNIPTASPGSVLWIAYE